MGLIIPNLKLSLSSTYPIHMIIYFKNSPSSPLFILVKSKFYQHNFSMKYNYKEKAQSFTLIQVTRLILVVTSRNI